ncbi:UNVERIFIED_CONTAM: hypothetical protein K2H54_040860 [Gekko kuhli]
MASSLPGAAKEPGGGDSLLLLLRGCRLSAFEPLGGPPRFLEALPPPPFQAPAARLPSGSPRLAPFPFPFPFPRPLPPAAALGASRPPPPPPAPPPLPRPFPLLAAPFPPDGAWPRKSSPSAPEPRSPTYRFTAQELHAVLYGALPAAARQPHSPGLTVLQTVYVDGPQVGVFCTQAIPKGVRFGPFQGRVVNTSEIKTYDDNSLMWEIFEDGRLSHFIDGRGASGNWMALVNCARFPEEQNMTALQCQGQIYYETCKEISPGQELLVWYGDCYLQFLGIPISLKGPAEGKRAQQHCEESVEGYKCERCGKVFAYKYYRDKHLKYTRCVDRGDRKFPCHLCNRSFEKRDRLRIHVLHVHEKHRPHKELIRESAAAASPPRSSGEIPANADRPARDDGGGGLQRAGGRAPNRARGEERAPLHRQRRRRERGRRGGSDSRASQESPAGLPPAKGDAGPRKVLRFPN